MEGALHVLGEEAQGPCPDQQAQRVSRQPDDVISPQDRIDEMRCGLSLRLDCQPLLIVIFDVLCEFH